MADIEKDMRRHNNLRKVLLLLIPFLVIISVILIALKNSFLDELGAGLLFCAFLDAAIVAILLKKYYNWSLVTQIIAY